MLDDVLALNLGFVDKKIVTQQTVGEVLRKVREGAGLSLEQVAVKARIRAEYLKSLEQGNYEAIVGEVYVKNFIRQYAMVLGLNTVEVVSRYQKERDLWRLVKNEAFRSRGHNLRWHQQLSQKIFTPWFLRRLSVGLLILTFVGYLGHELYRIIKPPGLVLSSPVGDLITDQGSIQVKGLTELDVKVWVNNQLVTVTPQGSFQEEVELQPGLNLVKIEAKRKHSRPHVLLRHVLLQNRTEDRLSYKLY